MFLQLFVIKESLMPQKSFTAGLFELFGSFVNCAGGSPALTDTASKIKLISVFKGWRSQGLRNESQTSVQLGVLRAKGSKRGFSGSRAGTRSSAWRGCTLTVVRLGSFSARGEVDQQHGTFRPLAWPEGARKGDTPVKCKSSGRWETACCL